MSLWRLEPARTDKFFISFLPTRNQKGSVHKCWIFVAIGFSDKWLFTLCVTVLNERAILRIACFFFWSFRSTRILKHVTIFEGSPIQGQMSSRYDELSPSRLFVFLASRLYGRWKEDKGNSAAFQWNCWFSRAENKRRKLRKEKKKKEKEWSCLVSQIWI